VLDFGELCRTARRFDSPNPSTVIAIPPIGIITISHRQANDNPSDHDQEQKKGHPDDKEHCPIVA
jgi:hypothetical protein